ncbi:MAG: response regulator [Deltaproteobacteria bacterium]|nr:response regulator [Deltaproteobacteria bacterium]
MRLLLIDDDRVFRNALARMLRLDFDVVAVASADEAMALLLAGEAFDALVTDLEMPGCDGFQAIARIRAVDARLARRAVICTGAHLTDDEIAAHATRGFVILPKGSATTELVQAIRDRIGEHP